MLKAKCIERYKDKRGNITGYLLEDMNGERRKVIPIQLKTAIRKGQIEITNLTLTSDNRLIEKETTSNKSESKSLNSGLVAKSLVYILEVLMDMGDSMEELAENMIGLADAESDGIDPYDVEELYDDPEYRDCEEDDDAIVQKIINKYAYIVADKKPKAMQTQLECIFINDDLDYMSWLESELANENVNNIKDSKIYKSLCVLYKYAQEHNLDSNLLNIMRDYIKHISNTNMSVVSLAEQLSRKYYQYLDDETFGVTHCNSGNKITDIDIRKFPELEKYEYICKEQFTRAGGPQTPICALFREENGDVIIDVKLSRTGLIGKSTVDTVGYIKDITSVKLDKTKSVDELAKQLADIFNKVGKSTLEYAKTHPEITEFAPLKK